MLIDTTTQGDLDFAAAVLVEYSSHLTRLRSEITAIDPDGIDALVGSLRLELPFQPCHLLGGPHRVVGVDEQRRARWPRGRELAERLAFVVMRFDVGVRHGTRDWDSPQPSGLHSRGGIEAREVCGA